MAIRRPNTLLTYIARQLYDSNQDSLADALVLYAVTDHLSNASSIRASVYTDEYREGNVPLHSLAHKS